MTNKKVKFVETILNWFSTPSMGRENDVDFLEEAYDEVTKPHWINVEDELPKNRELVFITDCEFVDMGFYDYTDDAWQPYEKWLGSITHWMPLPSIEHLKKGK